jgi:hypothetical protein
MRIVNAFSFGADVLTLSEGIEPVGTEVTGASATGLSCRCRVTFEWPLSVDPASSLIGNPDNYHLREKETGRRLYVLWVELVNSATVDLVTEEFPVRPREYTLLVRHLTDTYGHVVVGGDGTTPQVEFTTVGGTDLPDASTLHEFWGLAAGFQADTSIDIDPDIDPPVLQNQDPYPGQAIVALDADIILEVVDDETGVNVDATKIELDRGAGTWETIWQNDAEQPGYPASRTALPNGYRYWIEHVVPFEPDMLCRVRVTAQDNASPIPNAGMTVYSFQTFNVTGFITTDQTGDSEITLHFAYAMELLGEPGDALRDPLSYELTALYIGLPAGVFHPTAVVVVNSTTVRLIIPLTTDGEAYRLEVVGDLETVTGASITGALSDYMAVVSHPRVTSVVATSSRTLEVAFDREMADNADLINPSAYVFSGGLRAEIVERIAPDRVKVITTPQTLGASYQLSVKAEP